MSGSRGSFRIFPNSGAENFLRSNAAIILVIVFKGDGLLIFDRALCVVIDANEAENRSLLAIDIHENGCIVPLLLPTRRNLSLHNSLAHRFEPEASKTGDKSLESIF